MAMSCGAPPSSVTSPASASMSPSHSEIAVDLPAPFGPSTASNSPRRTSISIEWSAVTAPYFLVMPRNWATGPPLTMSAGGGEAGEGVEPGGSGLRGYLRPFSSCPMKVGRTR